LCQNLRFFHAKIILPCNNRHSNSPCSLIREATMGSLSDKVRAYHRRKLDEEHAEYLRDRKKEGEYVQKMANSFFSFCITQIEDGAERGNSYVTVEAPTSHKHLVPRHYSVQLCREVAERLNGHYMHCAGEKNFSCSGEDHSAHRGGQPSIYASW